MRVRVPLPAQKEIGRIGAGRARPRGEQIERAGVVAREMIINTIFVIVDLYKNRVIMYL